jgi:hypothetical protein
MKNVLRKALRKEVKYFVNEEKRTIVATANVYLPLREVCDKVIGVWVNPYMLLPKVKYPESVITEKAICAPEDEWNVEYGKKVAFEKLYRRHFRSLVGTMFENFQSKTYYAVNNQIKAMGYRQDKDFTHEYK